MRLFGAAVATFLLAACGGDKDPWTYGEVVEREFTPAHIVHHPPSWRDGGQTCSPSYEYDWFTGDYMLRNRCTDNPDVYVPPWDEHVPDRWRVLVSEDSDGSDESAEQHWITVSRAVHDECREGRRYDRNSQECPLR